MADFNRKQNCLILDGVELLQLAQAILNETEGDPEPGTSFYEVSLTHDPEKREGVFRIFNSNLEGAEPNEVVFDNVHIEDDDV